MKNLACTFLSLLVIALLATCTESTPKETPHYSFEDLSQTFFYLDSSKLIQNPSLLEICQLAKANAAPQLDFYQKLTSDWQFSLGDPVHGLKVSYHQKPKLDTFINLPHRINYPNWPFWYERSFFIDQDVFLYANGDDGVQCFLNGELQNPILGNFFEIPAQNDSVVVTLRVLNNALAGGLRSVQLIKAAEFHEYLEKSQMAKLLQQLVFLAYQQEHTLNASDWSALKEAIIHSDTLKLKLQIEDFRPLRMPLMASGQGDDAEASPFSFTAWGDSQGGWQTFSTLIKQMAAWPDPFSIGLGDLVSNGINEQEWLAFTQSLQPLLNRQVIFPIIGNHDYDGYYNDLDPLLYKQYVLADSNKATYQSWTYNGAYFLALDPNETFPLGIKGAQGEWFKACLNSAEWQAANWRFLLIHQPPYSQGWPAYHGDEFIREIVDTLAEEKQIDFVLSGHSHDYERLTKTYGSQKTHFFILGGAGGGLEPPESSAYPKMDTIIKQHHFARFEVDTSKVKVSIYGLGNQLLDQWISQK